MQESFEDSVLVEAWEVCGILKYCHAILVLVANMSKTKVTSKFQITIPKDVREAIGLESGEVVLVESVSDEEVVVRRFRRIKEPLKVLIGTKPFERHIPVEELEEKVETR